MTTSALNPVQLHLLRMFAYEKDEERLLQVQQVLTAYFRKELDAKMDALWDAGILDQKKLDELRGMHIRDILNK
ncbi:MAG: hypothetical protein HUK02_02610 [Bacteroidaceae bacterium]|nr:hypothetical protein [Bacteroidaceae bacterium]